MISGRADCSDDWLPARIRPVRGRVLRLVVSPARRGEWHHDYGAAAGVHVQAPTPEPASGNEQMSTDTATSTQDVTETAKTDEASTRPTEPVLPTVRLAPSHPSHRRRPCAPRRLGLCCVVPAGCARNLVICRTAAMAAIRPPRPTLPPTGRRRPDPPRSHHRRPRRPQTGSNSLRQQLPQVTAWDDAGISSFSMP